MNKLLILSGVLLCLNANAQNFDSSNNIQSKYQIQISKTNKPIKIDGILDDEVWQKAEKATNFWRKFPIDKSKPQRQTIAQVAFDDEFLYVSFEVFDSGNVIIQSLKRDFGHDGQDGVAIVLDPMNQHANGLFFVVNALNAQSEDQLSAGGNINWSWDNKWFSATKLANNKWTAEMAIPFKTLRYDANKTTWGINFIRIDSKTNEYSCWTPVPINFASHDLGYTGVLNWKQSPPKPGGNIVFQPYITASADESKQNNEPIKAYGNIGFDSKITLSSALNLDITVNPDFSQVDVDRQVTNLSRFNIFFPERRTFFLENSDLFSDFGIPPIKPFYSRRIGLDNKNNKIPILLGARLSGNISKKTRIGLMNMQTGKTDTYAAENYTAVTVHQRVLKRSTIKGYFLNRQAFLNETEKQKDPLLQFGRNAGLDFNYTNLSGSWSGWATYHKSYKQNITTDNHFGNFGVGYEGRKFSSFFDFVSTGTNYYTDIGFVNRIENYDAVRDTSIRVGFKQIYSETAYRILPQNGIFNQHKFEINNFVVWNPDNTINEQEHRFSYVAMLKNASHFYGNLTLFQSNLLFPISFTGATPLPAVSYNYNQVSFGYNSDYRKEFNLNLNMTVGDFYNGKNTEFSASITYRKRPHLTISINTQYNKLVFPSTYGSTELFLIAPRIEYNFTTNLFWTTFLQYNTQQNNFNINSRLQWRYKPMSDLFLVYSDNYFTTPLLVNKSRAIVFKMNYWFNL